MTGKDECKEDNRIIEEDSWDTLKSPKCGRYKFGWSLGKYNDYRKCKEAGIMN